MIKSLNNIQNLHYRTLIYVWQKKLVLRNHILILSVFSRESVYMHTDQREKIYDGSFWNCKGLKRKLPKVEHQHCTHIYIVPFANNQPFIVLLVFFPIVRWIMYAFIMYLQIKSTNYELWRPKLLWKSFSASFLFYNVEDKRECVL